MLNKKDREKKKQQKRKQKQEKAAQRKANSGGGDLESMMAYLDADGNIVDKPVEMDEEKEEVDPESIAVSVPRTEHTDTDEGIRGRVAFFNKEKKYGFIDRLNSKERYFVHEKGLKTPIHDGDEVQFTLEKGDRGLIAVNVEKIGAEERE